jgi:uncharacterized membrane protein
MDMDERRRREREAKEAHERNVKFFAATREVRGTLETVLRFLIVDGAPWWSLVLVWVSVTITLHYLGTLIGLAPNMAKLPDWYAVGASVLVAIPVVVYRTPIRRVLYLIWRSTLYLGIAAVVLFVLAVVVMVAWDKLGG